MLTIVKVFFFFLSFIIIEDETSFSRYTSFLDSFWLDTDTRICNNIQTSTFRGISGLDKIENPKCELIWFGSKTKLI